MEFNVVRLTNVSFATPLELLMCHHFVHFLGHGFHMQHNQLVQVRVGIATGDLERFAKSKLILLSISSTSIC